MKGVSAAVMAGGRSRRMGADKGWLDLGDGRPIVQRVIDALAEVADDVFVVANDERYGRLGLPVVRDRYLDGGALGGIATGIGAAANDRVLVAACDLPFLDPDVLRLLVQRAAGQVAVVPRVGGELQALHALYTKGCLPTMESALAAGRLRVADVLRELDVLEIGEDELRLAGPHLASFTNVNTPDDLTAARERSREPRFMEAGRRCPQE